MSACRTRVHDRGRAEVRCIKYVGARLINTFPKSACGEKHVQ